MSESQIDVLIIGAGPAGLFLATQLSKLKINTRIVDKQAHPVLRGHADGLQCRTGEVFTALGVQSRFNDETHECAEVVIWNADENGHLQETSRVVDTLPGTSHVRHVNLGQDRVEAIFIEAMKKNNGLEVERLIAPQALVVDENKLQDPTAYPISVTLHQLPAPKEWANGDVKSGLYRSNLFAVEEPLTNGSTSDVDEVVHCKYVVGCDGARSWVRRQLGLELKGDSANVYWGAFDAIIKTDIPTLRMKNVFHSANSGSVLTVPREGGMVRVYTQMGDLETGQRLNRSDITLEKLLEKTQAVVHPHTMEFCYVDWYTCYEIGQRVCDTFAKHQEHVFIAGDACHTHSPKAGQGMNVSMMDTWNLGWKLASVIKGESSQNLLKTYHQERQATAQELIDFDYEWSRMLGSKDVSAVDMDKAWKKSMKFTSGTGVVYKPNLVVDEAGSATTSARKVIIGSHFPNHQVVESANAHTIQLQERIRGDGRWRILVFPGDISKPVRERALLSLAHKLDASDAPSRRALRSGMDIDSVVEVITVVHTPHRQVQSMIASMPLILVPERSPYGVKAVDTFYSDEESWHDGHGHAYEGYGIDPDEGCVILVRPDQYVSAVYPLSGYNSIKSFFDRFMLVTPAPA